MKLLQYFKSKQPKTKEELRKEILILVVFILLTSTLSLFVRPINVVAEPNIDLKTHTVINDAFDKDANTLYEISFTDDENEFIIDEIVSNMCIRAYQCFNSFVEMFVTLLSSTFEPSLNPLKTLEDGKNITFNAVKDGLTTSLEAEKSSINDSQIILTIWNFAMSFGIITATLLALFALFMCVVGRSEDIKDSPFMIGLKYAVSLFLIFVSKYFMTGFINLFNDVWNNFVINDDFIKIGAGGPTTPSELFLPIRETGVGIGIFGVVIAPLLTNPLGLLIFGGILIVGIGLAVKLIKEFLKLFLEIVERYFVFFILIAFFPCLAATLTTNNSKKIFYAYLKMVYCQGFLLIINTIFMGIFFSVGLKGGWTAGFLNYLAALAFLRVCQRIDAYMAQMGFNVVQTGAGLAGAIGGAGMGFLSAMKGLQMLDRGRTNIGKGIMQQGISSNNSSLAQMGATIGASAKDVIGGSLNHDSIQQTIMNQQAEHISSKQDGIGGGRVAMLNTGASASNPNGDWSSLRNSMKDFGMSDVQSQQAVTALQQAGYSPNDCASITQNDASAKSFTIGDGNEGGNFATFTGRNSDILDKAEKDLADKEHSFIANPNADETAREPLPEREVSQADKDAIMEYMDTNGVTKDLHQQAFDNGDFKGKLNSDDDIKELSSSYSENAMKNAREEGTAKGLSGDALEDYVTNAGREAYQSKSQELRSENESYSNSAKPSISVENEYGDAGKKNITVSVGTQQQSFTAYSIASHPEKIQEASKNHYPIMTDARGQRSVIIPQRNNNSNPQPSYNNNSNNNNGRSSGHKNNNDSIKRNNPNNFSSPTKKKKK